MTTPSEPNPADFGETAKKTVDAGIADETAGYAEATALNEEDNASGKKGDDVPTEGGLAEEQTQAQPS